MIAPTRVRIPLGRPTEVRIPLDRGVNVRRSQPTDAEAAAGDIRRLVASGRPDTLRCPAPLRSAYVEFNITGSNTGKGGLVHRALEFLPRAIARRFPRLCTGTGRTPGRSRRAAASARVRADHRRRSSAGCRSPSHSPDRSLTSGLLAAIAPLPLPGQRRSVTPDVVGSSPVAPASHSETKHANSRAFPCWAQLGSHHPEPPHVGPRQKNGDQTGGHDGAAWTGPRP